MQKGKHRAMSAWENSRYFMTPPLVSPREITSEKRLQKCFTTQIWVVILIGRTATEICFSQSEALPDLSSVWDYCNRFSDGISRGNQSGGVPTCRLFVQARAVHVISLLSFKIFHLHFFAWLRNYLSFYVFFFAIDSEETVKTCSLPNWQCDAAEWFTKSAATTLCSWYAQAQC